MEVSLLFENRFSKEFRLSEGIPRDQRAASRVAALHFAVLPDLPPGKGTWGPPILSRKLSVKIFFAKPKELEKSVNDWLGKRSKDLQIHHVVQCGDGNDGVTLTVFYSEG